VPVQLLVTSIGSHVTVLNFWITRYTLYRRLFSKSHAQGSDDGGLLPWPPPMPMLIPPPPPPMLTSRSRQLGRLAPVSAAQETKKQRAMRHPVPGGGRAISCEP
jgi:hypothetical protein